MAAFDIQHMLGLLEDSQSSDVIAALEPMVEDEPAHLAARVLLAQAYEAQARWNDALEAWQQARFFLPNSPVIAAGIQRVLEQQEAQPLAPATPPPMPTDEPAEDAPEPAEAPASTEEEAPADESTEAPSEPEQPSPRLSQMPRELQQLANQPGPAPDDSVGELDRLIQELESARIEPDPDLDSIPEPDLDDDIEDMVSETLARIYTSQEQYGEAARVYVKLASQDPDRAEEHLEKAAELRARAEEQEE